MQRSPWCVESWKSTGHEIGNTKEGINPLKYGQAEFDVNDGSYLTFSGTVVKVRADSPPNNKYVTILQFKMGNLVKFCQNSSKVNIFTTVVVFYHFICFLSKTTFSVALWYLYINTVYSLYWVNCWPVFACKQMCFPADAVFPTQLVPTAAAYPAIPAQNVSYYANNMRPRWLSH